MNMPKKDGNSKRHQKNQYSILNSTLLNCLKNTFVDSMKEWDSQVIVTSENRDSMKDIQFQSTSLITLASYDFKMIMVMYFDLDKSLREFAININHDKMEHIFNDTIVLDYIMEMSNSVGGRFKRTLQNTSYALGMSTPNIIARKKYVISDIADFDFISHFTAQVSTELASEPLSFGLSLFTRVDHIAEFEDKCKNAQLDRQQEEESVGELELF